MSVVLTCFPFAGAGASFFRPWEKLAKGELVVRALQLPGREWLIDEPPFREAHIAADALVTELLEDGATAAESLVLFGHSLGAVHAYEVARRLRALDRRVRRLFVSGSPGPWSTRPVRATGLADEPFLARVEAFAGYRHPVLSDPEMLELILPTLRADVEMHENYRPRSTEPIDVALTVLRGTGDELVTAEQAGEWASVTCADFAYVEVPGGHMYLVDSAHQVLDLVREHLGFGP